MFVRIPICRGWCNSSNREKEMEFMAASILVENGGK